jgi:Tol biopolymer transport system component
MGRVGMRRGLVVGAVGTACALFLGGAACEPPPATPLCGQGRHGQPGSLLSADGDHVAYLSDSLDDGPDANSTACDVFVRTLSTGVVERVSTDAGAASAPHAISSDGRLVLFPIGGTAHLVEVETGQSLWSAPAFRDAIDLTPDGRYLVWAEGRDLFRLDRTTGAVAQTAIAERAAIFSASIDDAGEVVAFGATSGLFTWDPASGTTQQLTSERTLQSELSPDGSTIARVIDVNADSEGNVALVDRPTGAMTVLETSWELGSMAWSTDGAWVTFESSEQTLAGDIQSPDLTQLYAPNTYAYRLRDHRIVRLYHPGFWGWPTGPTINLAFTGTDRNAANSPQTQRFAVVALEP